MVRVKKINCDRYRHYFILEVKGKLPFRSLWEIMHNLPTKPLFKNKRERKKLSRYYFAAGMPLWSYPPYCRYGYYCKDCPFDVWGKKSKCQQLTLF